MLTTTQRLKILKKTPDHDKYFTTQEFNELTAENFAERIKQVNLASKNCMVDFVENTYFDEKLMNINKKVTSKEEKQILLTS